MATFAKWVTDATPASPMGDVVRAALEVRLSAVEHYLPRAAFLADESIEFVHAARVATRRATAALGMYREFVPSKARKTLRDLLKQMRGAMGEARDLDVYLERFAELNVPGARSLSRRLQQQRQTAQRPIVDTALDLLIDDLLHRRCQKVVKSVGEHGSKSLRRQPFGEWAAQQLKQAWVPFAAAVPGDSPEAEELHDFRIATKRFRYTLELLRGGLPEASRKLLTSRIKELQADLGAIQDHAVAAEKLAAWGQLAKKKKERELLDGLRQDELDSYRYKSEAFIDAWHHDSIHELQTAVEEIDSLA